MNKQEMRFDVMIVGAGAAGLMCAGVASQRGLRVALLDHHDKLAEKIRISGGGRCNFTNIHTTPEHFLSNNPHFCKSALARYTPHDFLQLLNRHHIGWHEKHRGQLFCDERSEGIITMLAKECDAGGVTWLRPCQIHEVIRHDGADVAQPLFELHTTAGILRAGQLVIATGGLSIPQIGATGWGYDIARQFGHRIVDTRPALVPLTFAPSDWQPFSMLSGLSVPVTVQTAQKPVRTSKKPITMGFAEDMLLTHRGLSGPAILQISSYWQAGQPLQINLHPQHDLYQTLLDCKQPSHDDHKKQLNTILASYLPRKLVDTWLAHHQHLNPQDDVMRRMCDLSHGVLQRVAQPLNAWQLIPNGTEGYKKAEVTTGGVDTRELDSHTMQSKRVAGLYFIGEVMDVTGHLGGFNFQWAWASAVACAKALIK
jgi:predicted Rossmann fold flavoprotein